MRFFAVSAVVVTLVLAIGASSRVVLAAEVPGPQVDAPVTVQPAGETADSDNDDTANVQLVVLAVAGGVVFLLLPLGYLLRRRLGLTAYTPPPDAH